MVDTGYKMSSPFELQELLTFNMSLNMPDCKIYMSSDWFKTDNSDDVC